MDEGIDESDSETIEPRPPPSLQPPITWRQTLVRRPAISMVLLLIAGISSYATLKPMPAIWVGLSATLLLLTALLWRKPRRCTVTLSVAVFFAGAAMGQIEAFYYPPDHIAHYATDTPRLAWLELHIDEPPRILSNAFGIYRSLPPKQVTLGSLRRIKTWNRWTTCEGEILVQIAQPHPRLAAGQTIRVIGMLQRPGPAMNPGQFDWARYYRDQRVLASLQIQQVGNIQIIDDAPPSRLTRLREAARQLLAAGFPAERSLDHALLRALVLGDRDPEMRDVQEQFKQTGTSHHLSLSGFHVALVCGLIVLACRLVRLSPRKTTCIGLVFAVLYGLIAMPTLSAVRAVILCVAFGAALLLRRGTDRMQLLAVAILAMLVMHPMDLFNDGFQLGIFTVVGLMLFIDPVMNVVHRLRGDQLDPDFRDRTLWVRFTRWFDHWLTYLFIAGFVAWLISMPLIAMYFEQLNPWAIPAGIVLGPIVLLALLGGVAKVFLTLVWPSGATIWALAAAEPIVWTRHLVQWLALLPGSSVPLPAPAWWLIAAYYAALALFLIPTHRPKWQLALRFVPVGACLVVLFLPLWTGRAAAVAITPKLKLSLLAIGAGQTAVVQTPAGRTVMVDAGSMAQTDLVRKVIGPFLREAGQRQVDTIFLTHGDYDHISGVADIVAAYDVHDLFVSPRFRYHAIGVAPTEGLLHVLDQYDRPPRVLSRGESMPLGRDVEVNVLWPPKTSQLSSNDDALVMRFTYAGRSILFTGDIQEDAEKRLMADPSQLKSDVLIAPHHGSSENTTAAFIRAVDPQIILSSNDRHLSGKQKRLETITADRPLYRTNRCGAITVTIDEAGTLDVQTFLKSK